MSIVTTYLLPFIVLLGILVTVHEAGHFLTAKYFKITVERFSIGFGPRIFGKKIGDTEYRLAWIPLGGYVKMAGDDPSDEAAKSVPGGFLGAPLLHRMLVVLAGPGVNLILPIFILAVVFMIGRDYMAAQIGSVNSNTPAATAGLQAGDRVIAVDGVAVNKWQEMTEKIRSHGAGEKVALRVVRGGKTLDVTLIPEMKENLDELGVKRMMPLIGISPLPVAATVAVAPGSIADKAGLKTGDRITEFGATKITSLTSFLDALHAAPEGSVALKIARRPAPGADIDSEPAAEAPITATLVISSTDPAVAREQALGISDSQLVVASVASGSPADHAGVLPGDRLVSVDERSLASAGDFFSWLRFENPKADTRLVVNRDGKDVTLAITPVMRTKKLAGAPRPDEIEWAGLSVWENPSMPAIFTEQYRNPISAVAAGFRGTWEVVRLNVKAFGMIFRHEIKLKDSVGGPIRIAQAAGNAAKDGLAAFIDLLVNMSVILGIMNLLPIPVLDGGHLAFFTIEAIIRRPPSLRVREVAQQVGMLLLLAVMAFVMVNDVVSSFF